LAIVYFLVKEGREAWSGVVAWEIKMEHAVQRLAREQSVCSAAITGLTMITVVACTSSGSLAQDFDAGKSEYQASCEACHGADGKGKGPLSAQLKVPPADLTVLAKKNNGVFPVQSVYEVIDGRQAILSHGTRDMPIWGNRYTVDQIQIQQALRNYPYYDPEATVQIRILSVIDYLYQIQEK
jgi:mono/diheme cytochrome c family protein